MKTHSIFLPPVWLVVLLSVVGIVGMNLFYTSLTNGGFIKGIIGGSLLFIATVVLGTPLAFAQQLRRQSRDKRKSKSSSD
jgi:hypothetical protein